MIQRILLFVIGFFSLGSVGQDFEWAKSIPVGGIDEGQSLVTDDLGNVYTTGRLIGTGGFVRKYGPDGTYLWTFGLGYIGTSIKIDGQGNIIVVGTFYGTDDFDPGPGIYNLTTSGAFDPDCFTAKYDSDGNFLWALRAGNTANDRPESVDIDASGNVYVTGSFEGTVDFDPGPGIYNLASPLFASDVFVVKYDPLGNFIWAKAFGGNSIDYGRELVVDNAGDVVLTGSFRNAVDFDPGVGVTTLTSTGGSEDIFISKLDAFGNFIWAKRIGASSEDVGYSLAVDTLDNIYATGHFHSTVDFDPSAAIFNLVSAGVRDIFVLKLNELGNFVWAKRFGSASDDYGKSICVDADDVYITGDFQSTVDFDPGAGIYNLISAGLNDMFVCKLTMDGNFGWARRCGGTGVEQGNAITYHSSGAQFCIGSFETTADFDPGPGVFNLVAVSSSDVFILKMNCLPTTSNLAITACFNYTVPSGDEFYTVSGIYNDTITNASGCDSVLIIDLTIITESTSAFSVSSCSQYIVPSGDEIYFSSGTYMDTISNVYGCDSVMTINVSIVNPSSATLNVSSCGSYVMPSGDETYFSSGVYMDTIPNSVGCDSILTINVEIIPNSNNSISITSCGPYTVPSGDEIYSMSGIYSDTIPNIFGCDSMITITLDVLTTYNFIAVSQCDPYTVPSGDETYTTTGVYQDTIPNFSGCDSIITINLTIDTINPTATNPPGISVEFIGDVPAPNPLVVTTEADNSGAPPIVAFVSDVSDGNTCPELITRTYSVTDTCGNTINVTQSIFVDDPTAPTASNPPGISVECIFDVPTQDPLVVTTEADNSGVPPIVAFVSDMSNGNTCPEEITRTYSVTDACANTINVTQVIFVNDITIPTASNPATINVTCASSVPAANSAVVTTEADNCTANPVVVFVSDVSDGDVCNNETITRTYSITDNCGNMINVTQQIVIGAITPNINAGNDQTICEGTEVTLTAVNLDAAAIIWNNGVVDGIAFIPPVGTTSYTVTGSICGLECQSADVVVLTVNSADNSVTQSGITLTANATGATYQWLDCNNAYAIIPGETNQSFTPIANGNYAASITENGCTDTSNCFAISNIGLSENKETIVSVYPNPSNGKFTIVLKDLNQEKVDFQITNSLGQLVYSGVLTSSENQKEINLATGIYYLKINSGVGLETIELIVTD